MTRGPLANRSRRGDRLARLLRATDPVGAEPPLQPTEEATMQRTLDRIAAAGSRSPRRRPLGALAAAAALVVAFVAWNAVVRVPSPPSHAPVDAAGRVLSATTAPALRPHHLAPPVPLPRPQPLRPSGALSQAESSTDRRSIYLTATNGTRIVWSVSAKETPDEPGSRKSRS